MKYRGLWATVFLVPMLSLYGFETSSYYSNWYSPAFGLYTSLAFVLIFGSYFVRHHFYSTAFFAAGTFAGLFLVVNALIYATTDYSNLVWAATAIAAIGTVFSLISLFVGEHNLGSYISESFQRIFTGAQHKVLTVVTQVVFAGLFVLFSYGIYLFNGDQSSRDFKFFLALLVRMLFNFFTLFTFINVLNYLLNSNWGVISDIFAKLDETSLSTYVTRQISSWIYAVTRWGVFVGVGFAIAQNLKNYSGWPQLWVFPILLPLGLLASYVVLMGVRIVIEYTNALIHVAQNTSR